MVVKNLNQTNGLKKGGSNVVCRKCKSDQIVANKRGYSFGIMFKVLFSMVGVGVVGHVIAILTLELKLGTVVYEVALLVGFLPILLYRLPYYVDLWEGTHL